jgi:hypothetical protein
MHALIAATLDTPQRIGLALFFMASVFGLLLFVHAVFLGISQGVQGLRCLLRGRR